MKWTFEAIIADYIQDVLVRRVEVSAVLAKTRQHNTLK